MEKIINEIGIVDLHKLWVKRESAKYRRKYLKALKKNDIKKCNEILQEEQEFNKIYK